MKRRQPWIAHIQLISRHLTASRFAPAFQLRTGRPDHRQTPISLVNSDEVDCGSEPFHAGACWATTYRVVGLHPPVSQCRTIVREWCGAPDRSVCHSPATLTAESGRPLQSGAKLLPPSASLAWCVPGAPRIRFDNHWRQCLRQRNCSVRAS